MNIAPARQFEDVCAQPVNSSSSPMTPSERSFAFPDPLCATVVVTARGQGPLTACRSFSPSCDRLSTRGDGVSVRCALIQRDQRRIGVDILWVFRSVQLWVKSGPQIGFSGLKQVLQVVLRHCFCIGHKQCEPHT